MFFKNLLKWDRLGLVRNRRHEPHMGKYKPCPFCGAQPVVQEGSICLSVFKSKKVYSIKCCNKKCLMNAFVEPGSDISELWNKRFVESNTS